MNIQENLQKNGTVYYVALLILVTVIILSRGINHGDFWHADDARHAMDGVFMLDFIKDLPLLHIYDYVTQYFAKYPALGIGVYPPFFALVEAAFYALFGISIFTAKLTVLFFAIISVVFWFKLVSSIYDERTALYSSLLLITTPFIVKWSKSVMLEMPALAMILMSVYFLYGYFDLDRKRHGWYLVLSTAAAIYAKQTAVFLIPFFLLYLVMTKRLKRLLDKDVFIKGLALSLLILPLAVFTLKLGKMNIIQSVGSLEEHSRLLNLGEWLLYLKLLPLVLTGPVLVLSAVSILVVIFKRDRKSLLFLAWIIGFYLTFSYISEKAMRYTYFWLPPFMLFAVLILNGISWRLNKVHASTVLLIALCTYQFILSFNIKNPYINGYEEAARYILEKQKSSVIFYHGSGRGNGNFIFHIRSLDRDRRMVVLRGDKLLASSAIFPNNMLVEHVKGREETYDILQKYGVEYIIVEKEADYGINAYKILRSVLESDDFTLVKKIDIDTDDHDLKGESILIYKNNNGAALDRDPVIDIRLSIIGARFSAQLKTLSKFYTPSGHSGPSAGSSDGL